MPSLCRWVGGGPVRGGNSPQVTRGAIGAAKTRTKGPQHFPQFLEGNLGTLAAGLNCSPSLPTSRARRWQSPGSPRLEKYLYDLCQKQRDLRRQSLGPTTHPPRREASQERNRSRTATLAGKGEPTAPDISLSNFFSREKGALHVTRKPMTGPAVLKQASL